MELSQHSLLSPLLQASLSFILCWYMTLFLGSGLNSDVVILMGIANLLADGISMGLGDYLSEVAENKFVNHERARELW